MAVTCVMMAEALVGVHYMPSPTITLVGYAGANNSAPAITAMGATEWTAVDIDNNVVGTGAMSSSATTITVCSAGSWVGGSAAEPGHYTVYTNSGSNGVVTATVSICTAGSNIPAPSVWYPAGGPYPTSSFAAWLASSPDRDQYQLDVIDIGEGSNPTQLVATANADPYFQGVQDAARPHRLWIAPYQQADAPTQNPTAASWGTCAAYLAANGWAGAHYELPTNEPENGGWTITETITYWNECATAVLAGDSTAKAMGWCSGGIYNSSPITDVATFLADATSTVSGFTNHMENSYQNLADHVMLRQYFGGLKAQFAASGVPNLDYWNTETGIEGGQYNCLHPRREARQRTLLRLVAEQYGWAKENQYDFSQFDHIGSGIATYQVDYAYNAPGTYVIQGNMRAGAYAVHVMADALFGTVCSPTSIPTALSFGAAGSLGDSLFMGSHYTAAAQSDVGFAARDVVVLAASVESDTVTLDCGTDEAASAATCWDGMGRSVIPTVDGTHITVPVNDLLTYVFLPHTTTVSVIDTGSGVLSVLNSATNIALTAGSFANESGPVTGVPNDGTFGANSSGITGVEAPYADPNNPTGSTPEFPFPATLTASEFAGGAQDIVGVAIKTQGPPWQSAGCGLTAFELVATIGGTPTVVYSYTCPSAISYPIPSASFANDNDPCVCSTWYTGAFAFIISLALTGVTALQLKITNLSYGGQPDLAAWENWASTAQGAQSVFLAAMQVYNGTPSPDPPVNLTAPVVTGTTVVGDVLSGTNGTWQNSPTSFAYQWQKSANGTSGWANESSATVSTYTLVSGDLTYYLRFAVTATNANGSATAYSNVVGPVTSGATSTWLPARIF